MEMLLKAARLEKAEADASELELINRQTLRPLAAEEVFCFRLAACDNQVDRDGERFTEATLQQLAELYVGRPILLDHVWSAKSQTARVYAAAVEAAGATQQLVLRCYMPRSQQTEPTITAIEAGILRECSVGCAVRRVTCSICGADQRTVCCEHYSGREYNGQVCHMDLEDAVDAYEVSLLPVPAQPAAGVTKAKRYGGKEKAADPPEDRDPGWQAEAVLALENEKYKYNGGTEA